MKIGYLMQAGAPRMVKRPFSGPAVHVREVCRFLREMGHDVRLLLVSEKRACVSGDGLNFEPVDGRIGRWLARRSLLDSVAFAAACRRELGDRDVLYERMGWLGYGGVLAARTLGIPLVMEANGDHLWERETVWDHRVGPIARRLYLSATRRTLASAKHVVASGAGWRQQLIERFRLPPTHVTVVHNGSTLVESLRREDLRSFADADDTESVRIAYVGGFYPWHGVPRLLHVIRRLADASLPVRLMMIGTGPGEPAARTLVGKLGIADRTVFCGELPPSEYGAKLATFDVGVTAYWGTAEYVGLKLMDYKAAGLAVVATGHGGQPEVIEHGRTGLVVPPADDDALHDALVSLVRDGARRRDLGRQARIDAEANHSWRRTAERIEGLLSAAARRV